MATAAGRLSLEAWTVSQWRRAVGTLPQRRGEVAHPSPGPTVGARPTRVAVKMRLRKAELGCPLQRVGAWGDLQCW